MKRVCALIGLITVLLSGCVRVGSAGQTPECAPEDGGVQSGVLLMAQSVPTATWVPCVITMPVGWQFEGMDARDGTARFWLDSDRDGVRAVEVELGLNCEVAEATEVPSDHERMRRYERVHRIDAGYSGKRYYVFTGGCVTYHFNLYGTTRAEPLAAVSLALGFVSRDTMREQVRQDSDGRIELDPREGGG